MAAFAALPDATERATPSSSPRRSGRRTRRSQGEVDWRAALQQDAVRRAAPSGRCALRADLERRVPDRYRFHPAPPRGLPRSAARVVDTRGPAGKATSSSWRPVRRTTTCPNRRPSPYRAPAGAAADARDVPFRRHRDHLVGRCRLAALLPGLRSGTTHRLPAQNAVGAAHRLQLLLVQRLDGGLTIGDTHAYDEPFDFALSEDPTEELLARASRILGRPLPPVRRRWEGVYAQCLDGAVCLREEIERRSGWSPDPADGA